jgi:ParB family chromosome partitioning protein
MIAQPRTEHVKLDQIQPPAHRLRESISEERLGELADSMAAEGLHQPIGLRGPLLTGNYEVVWGDRRTLAARRLQWDAIEAKIFPPEYDPVVAAITENLQREELTPLEEGAAIAQLVARGHSLAAIARLMRRSAGWVSARSALLTLPPDLQAAVRTGRLGLGVIEALREIDHAEYRASLVDEAERTGASRNVVDIWVSHYKADRERIVSNHLMVTEIVQRRTAYVVYVACDACTVETDYTKTVSRRFCNGCAEQLDGALSEAQGEKNQPAQR